jgi:hypothetical protein
MAAARPVRTGAFDDSVLGGEEEHRAKTTELARQASRRNRAAVLENMSVAWLKGMDNYRDKVVNFAEKAGQFLKIRFCSRSVALCIPIYGVLVRAGLGVNLDRELDPLFTNRRGTPDAGPPVGSRLPG